MTNICYLCGELKEVVRLPSGTNACILCIWQYLPSDDKSEGAEIISDCAKECKSCSCKNEKKCESSEEENLDWTADNIKIEYE